jgi:hypothetical protein
MGGQQRAVPASRLGIKMHTSSSATLILVKWPETVGILAKPYVCVLPLVVRNLAPVSTEPKTPEVASYGLIISDI